MLYTAHLALCRYLCYMESEWQTCANDLILHLFHRYICKPSSFLSGMSLCLNLLSEYLVQIVVIDIFIKFAFSTRIISIMSLINHFPPICWSIFWKTSSVWEGFCVWFGGDWFWFVRVYIYIYSFQQFHLIYCFHTEPNTIYFHIQFMKFWFFLILIHPRTFVLNWYDLFMMTVYHAKFVMPCFCGCSKAI